MPALTPSTLLAFEQLAAGDYRSARRYAFEACQKDQTKKNEAQVYRIVAALQAAERARNDASLPPSLAGKARRESPNAFDEGLYVWTDRTRALAGDLSGLYVASSRLAGKGIVFTPSLLMTGPTGSGKTEFAHAAAHSLDLPLVTASLSGLVDSLLGATGKAMAQLLGYASENPCVLFLDELDCVCASRGSMNDAGARELARVSMVVAQVLDRGLPGSVLLAATNLPGEVDPALRRRFSLTESFEPMGPRQMGEMVRLLCERAEVSDHLTDRLVSDAEGAPSPAEGRRRAILAIAKELGAAEGGED